VRLPLVVRGELQGLNNLRSNFIAHGTNTYPTMHYDIIAYRFVIVGKSPYPFGEDSPRDPTPAGMQQRDLLRPGVEEVDRNAVGHGDIEHDPGDGGGMTIYPFDLGPPGHQPIMPEHPGLVYLVSQHMDRKSGLGVPQLSPPLHDLPDRIPGPEPQIEPGLAGASPGNTGDDTVPGAPAGDLVPGYETRDGNFLELGRWSGIRNRAVFR
jgi:hypothetical protein